MYDIYVHKVEVYVVYLRTTLRFRREASHKPEREPGVVTVTRLTSNNRCAAFYINLCAAVVDEADSLILELIDTETEPRREGF